MGEITPYLATSNAREAIDWYVEHLGAEVVYDPIVMPDGRVGHVELAVDGARWMMSDEHPEIHVQAPAPGRGAAVTLHLTVGDVDKVARAVVRGGAELDRGPEDAHQGRVAVFRDPFGHRWMVNG